MINIKTILEAWAISYNPTEKENELAIARLKICDNCSSKKELIKKVQLLVVCSECGCPLVKKIYTNSYNACPLMKWGEVDEKYFPPQKSKKTLV